MILAALGKMYCMREEYFTARQDKSPLQKFNGWRQRSKLGGGHDNKTGFNGEKRYWYSDSRGCHKKAPQTTWLKRAENCSILVLKVEVQNHRVSRALLPLKVLEENPFTPLS